MDIHKIKEPIAKRTLLMGADEVLVIIGKPQPFDADYFCPYLIEYADQKIVRRAMGVDAVQALQLAMKMIGTELTCLAKIQAVPVRWFPDSLPGDTGFPDE